MGTPQFVDVSQFQGNIDFIAYCAWARQWDGIARIAMKATEGTGFTDPLFRDNRGRALAAGIDRIYFYHFARPDLGNSPSDEANFMRFTVGNVRDSDTLILDYEVSSPYATAEWAYEWLLVQEGNYGKLPGLYASSAYIQQRLRDTRLARYPLWLANWQYTPNERPPVPTPWAKYEFVQYTDRATNVPGIPGTVDANIFLGKETPMTTVPAGWTDDGTTLTAPNKIPVTLGFRDHILNSNWDPANIPLESEQHLTVLEQSNPSLGAGQRQLCRWKSLEYTPKSGIFEGWLGQELQWHEKQYKALQAQNADLQKQITALQSQNAALQSLLSADTLAQELAALQAKVAQAVKDLAALVTD